MDDSAIQSGNTFSDSKLHYFKGVVNVALRESEHRDGHGGLLRLLVNAGYAL